MNGFLNVDKPLGMTSHDVVAIIRRIYGTKKVGHAGTLDPAAAGVLPIAIGKATRLLEYIVDGDKEYQAELTLGTATDSGDATGTVIAEEPAFYAAAEQLAAILPRFTGEIRQIPPMHSAIKVGGKKLYELARQGITVERPERVIYIEALEMLEFTYPKVRLRIVCSKGTYIRTLCEDLARALGTVGHMSKLVRTRVGSFDIETAVLLEELREQGPRPLISPQSMLGHLPGVILEPEQGVAFRQGKQVPIDKQAAPAVVVMDTANNLLGIGRLLPDGVLKPEKVFP